MSDQYLGEIRLFAGYYAPQGWAMCNGQTLSISQNDALYMLIGCTYGGDGKTVFKLPDMGGRIPVGAGTARTGTNYALGQNGGLEEVTLTKSTMPSHTHPVNAYNLGGNSNSPSNAYFAVSGLNQYATEKYNTVMNEAAVDNFGANVGHDNMMPFLTLTYIIALQGIYPTQS